MKQLGILEGLLFVMGDEGIDLKSLCEIMSIEEEEAKELLKELKKNYEEEDRGLRISYLGNAFKLTTKEEHKEYYEKLVVNPGTNKLSQAALETLAIIAYNQPITISEINEIRGVQTNQLIRKLVAKGLLKEVGKSDLAGRPNLYATTSEFLDYFGLATIEDLPTIDIKNPEENSETDLFTSIYKDEEGN
ncbi:MAG: SMC-Scp complex subunit ScpB [Erysipelotrichales bacterium]|nr:SMC-Scp complex subunit ScpB [Erysipelotrichales bacterium]